MNTATHVEVARIPVGNNAEYVAFSPDGSRTYISNYENFNASYYGQVVAVYDTATSVRLAQIPIGAIPTAIVVSPDGSRLYVPVAAGAVQVIDTATAQVIASIPVGMQSEFAAISPDGSRLYVSARLQNALLVVDTGTNTVTQSIPLSAAPYGVAVAPGGSHAYVANGSNVSKVDLATLTVTSNIAVGDFANRAAITPDGSRAYVTFNQTNHNKLSMIDLATQAVTPVTLPPALATVGKGAIHFSPDSALVYVHLAAGVMSLDTATHSLQAVMPVGTSFSKEFDVSPDGSLLLALNKASVTKVLDTATNNLVATLPAPLNLHHQMAISPNGQRLYIAGEGAVWGLNLATNTYLSRVPLYDPRRLAVTPDNSKVWVYHSTSGGTREVTVLNATTNAVVTQIPVSNAIYDIVFSPDGTRAYLTCDCPNGFSFGKVLVFSTATYSQIGTVTVAGAGGSPRIGLVVSPDGARLYASSTDGVTVIDTVSLTISATIPTPVPTYTLTLTPDGTKIYAAAAGYSAIAVIPTAGTTVQKWLYGFPGTNPFSLAVTPNGSRVYVVASFDPRILIVDTATDEFSGAIFNADIHEISNEIAIAPF